MQIKSNIKIIMILLISILLLVVIVVKLTGGSGKPPKSFEIEIFKIKGGYGYNICYSEQLLIRQEYIPTIKNKLTFSTQRDARKVANLVKDKLVKGKRPEIRFHELDSLQIVFQQK